MIQPWKTICSTPARRLEERVPAMKNKGRVRVGADADLVVFDAAKVRDRATYEQPDLPSEGIRDVLVGGLFVVRDGVLQRDALPGKAVLASVVSVR
jgi:N-acyl-D-aspartate/D-glutamate deacylase